MCVGRRSNGLRWKYSPVFAAEVDLSGHSLPAKGPIAAGTCRPALQNPSAWSNKGSGLRSLTKPTKTGLFHAIALVLPMMDGWIPRKNLKVDVAAPSRPLYLEVDDA